MTDTYQSFLNKQHANMYTPAEILDAVINKNLQTSILTKKRIIAGETNEVWEITTKEKKIIIARIAHSDSSKFYSEQWAIDQCESRGVPVPTMLAIEKITFEGKEITINLQNKIRGIVLKDFLVSAAEEEKKHFFRIAGETLAKIHSVPTTGCGDIDASGTAPEKNLAAWFYAEGKNERYLLELAEKHAISQTMIKKAYQYMKIYGNLFEDQNNYLLHGDYLPKHIFIEDKKITGILDWGEVRGGNPIFDFTYWKFFHPESFKWLIEGYTNKRLFDETFSLKLGLCMLLHGIFLFYHHAMGNHVEGLTLDKKNFENTLFLLQKYPI